MKNKHRASGAKPLSNLKVRNAEWRLLRTLAEDLQPYVDRLDAKVMREVAASENMQLYEQLGEYWGLQSINPTHHISSHQRDAGLYLFSSLLSKWNNNHDDLTSATLEQFYEYERHCREYNRTSYRSLTWSDDPKIQGYYAKMLAFIQEVLGDLDLRVIFKNAKFGSGATVKSSRKYGHRFYKYKSYPYEVTERCVPLARRAIAHDERWVRALEKSFRKPFYDISNCELFQVVPGNVIDFVPKSRKVYRTIAKEASCNMYLQLGVDAYIKHRLSLYGIQLHDQSLNQTMAFLGSIDNSLATLDLKGASGTVTCRIVEKTMPSSWLDLLYALRSDHGVMPDGTLHHYEMFSSMGNGYTFTLETLIFAAAVHAVGGKLGVDSHVYGDDIVIPSILVNDLLQLIAACGFIPNEAKSFFEDNHVRESCGHDYLRGLNIRPVFLKTTLRDQNLFQLCTLHNRLWAWWCRVIGDPEQPAILAEIRKLVPRHLHAYGPPLEDTYSSYFAVPAPLGPYTMYGYKFDSVYASPKTVDIEEKDQWFGVLSHSLDSCESEVGSRFTVTHSGDYIIRVKHGGSHTHVWPATYSAF